MPDVMIAKLDEAIAGFRVILADPPWTFRSNSLAGPGLGRR
jgi:hypothetical protein